MHALLLAVLSLLVALPPQTPPPAPPPAPPRGVICSRSHGVTCTSQPFSFGSLVSSGLPSIFLIAASSILVSVAMNFLNSSLSR